MSGIKYLLDIGYATSIHNHEEQKTHKEKRTGKMLNSDVIQEIIDCLSKPPKPLRVILFGSYAYGMPHVDSDIDLLVILDKDGKSNNYRTLIQNRQEISGRLQSLKKKYPVDLIVYTREEWEELKAIGTSFIREIEENGVFLT